MTTNTEHLTLAAVALIRSGPTPEVLDDLEACIALVRHERFNPTPVSMRGTCPSCGYRQRLRKTGVLQTHWSGAGTIINGEPWWFECPGSGKAPRQDGQ